VDLDALIELVERGDHAAVAAALRAEPALAAGKTSDGDTLLHIACWQKRAAIVRDLLALADAHALDARGCYGRTPLHYAVHEGSPASVPIVAALLARGADPSLLDDNGFDVARWAAIEMDAGLADVLALLRNPPPDDGDAADDAASTAAGGAAARARAAGTLDAAAAADVREPAVREVTFRVGAPNHYAGVTVYRGRDPTTGAWATAIRVDLATPAAGGGALGAACFPALDRAALARFAAALEALRARRTDSATLAVPDAHGLRIDVRAFPAGFRAMARAAPGGPPGVAAPLRIDLPLDDAALDALVERVRAACAALDAWAAADAAAP
jgi:hypothetical protein